jgi:hypothetical protein
VNGHQKQPSSRNQKSQADDQSHRRDVETGHIAEDQDNSSGSTRSETALPAPAELGRFGTPHGGYGFAAPQDVGNDPCRRIEALPVELGGSSARAAIVGRLVQWNLLFFQDRCQFVSHPVGVALLDHPESDLTV